MTNVYRIGVSIAMSNGVSPVLGVIAKDLMGINAKAGMAQAGFSRLKLAIGGAVAVFAGAAIIGGMAKLVGAGRELADQQGRMLAAGLSNKEVAEATGRAWQMSATIMGSRVHENLTAIAHLRAAIGDLGEAEKIAPAYQRNAVALSAITGRDGEGEAYKLAQAIHQSGAANDPLTKKLNGELFSQKMNLYTAMIAAGGGKLDAGALLMFQKQSGSYGGSLSDQGRINLVGLIQTMGGQKAGTQLSSLNRALKDGILQKSTLNAFEKVGLIDPSKVHSAGASGHGGGASPGGGVTFAPGALKNEAQFRSDLAGWVYGTLVPSLNKAGITSTSDQINWIQHSKLTTNPSRILAELIRNQGVDQQEAANVRKAAKVDQYSGVMGTSYSANEKALHDALKDMMTAFATPLIKPAIGAIQSITGVVKAVTAWAVVNPTAVKIIAGALVVLGAALVGFGVAAIAVAGFMAVAAGGTIGFVVAGIASIVGALTTLAVLNWGSIKKAGSVIDEFLTGLFKKLAAFLGLKQVDADIPAGKPGTVGAKKGDWIWDPAGSMRGNKAAGWDPMASYRNTAPSGGAGAVPPARTQGQPVVVHTTVQADGKTLAHVVSKHIANGFGANSAGPARPDPLASLNSPQWSFAR